MLTLRAAAELLSRASTLDDLAAIARAIGCNGEPAALDADTSRGLGLGAEVLESRIAPGAGALRALLVSMRHGASVRESLARISARLSSRAPHVLWILVAVEGGGHFVGVATWRGDRHPPRVVALVADRRRVLDSDAETLRTLAAAAGGSDLATHERWVEVLGREALTRRFYRELERLVRNLAASAATGSPAQRDEVALLYASRLLFLAFLEARGWLDGDVEFLGHGFDTCMSSGGGYHRHVLLPLFFGTLNTPVVRRASAARALGRIPFLNGGLFSRTPLERSVPRLLFSDQALGALFSDLFSRYRFTAREETADWSEAAVDPEMLGRAFESLMAAGERHSSGAFYTPQELVVRVADAGLTRGLARAVGDEAANRILAGSPVEPRTAAAARAWFGKLTVLDPACGSGAFLVYALERLAHLSVALGDDRPPDTIRRALLTRSIFGVDRNPIAVWLCELRLWLSVVIESDESDPMRVLPLPNLDRNVRVGDTLGAPAFGRNVVPGGTELIRLRERYARATGTRKESLSRCLDRVERKLAVAAVDARSAAIAAMRRDLLAAHRGRDLFGEHPATSTEVRRHRLELRAESAALRRERARLIGGGALAFSFDVHFADAAARGGFDLVFGNPPWVRLHRIAPAERQRLRSAFSVYRAAAWEAGATGAHAGRGFAAQVDLAALFTEQAVRLTQPDGVVALLLPAKLWKSLAGGGVRALIAAECATRVIEDHSSAPALFDASVYPSILVAERRALADNTFPIVTASACSRTGTQVTWRLPAASLPLDASRGSPWLLVPAEVRHSFDRLRAAGVPLAESAIGRPYLGVKCGCNDAFVVRYIGERAGIADVVAADGTTGGIEAVMLRPVARGESVRAWRRERGAEHIIWTHADGGRPLDRLPPFTARWLGRWTDVLARRADARRSRRWWILFRTEAARSDRPRVVWADVGHAPRAMVVDAGDPVVPLNSCYAARCRDHDDALALAALLNSPLAAAWLDVLAEPARGDYRRYLGWTMALFPLPANWDRARTILSPLGARALAAAGAVSLPELQHAVLDAYGLPRRDVAPLLAWCFQR